MKKAIFTCLAFCMIVMVLGTPAHAESAVINTEAGETVVYEDDTMLVTEAYIPGEFIFDEYGISPAMWPGYSIRNIRSTGTTTKPITISSDVLAAGGSQTFELSYSATTTVEGIMSGGAYDFNIKLGISDSATVKITRSYSYACPYDLNGKKVNSCTVTYHPRFTKYAFDEYLLEVKSGSGTAEALTGFHQIVTYTYK